MIAFEVFLNGAKLTTAGAENLCVLDAEVQALGKLGKRSTLECNPDSPPVDLFLSAGGMTSKKDGASDTHPTWISLQQLQIGDVVKVKIVETKAADVPLKELG